MNPNTPSPHPQSSLPSLSRLPSGCRRGPVFRAALVGLPLLGLLPGAVALPGVVPAARAADVSRQQFDVPAGPLAAALLQFAQQAGIQLSVDAGMTTGLTSPGVRGEQSIAGALAALLDNTGLEAVQRGGNEFTLRARPRPAGGAVTLPAVTVSAAPQRERPLGPVDGYVARRSITAGKADIPLLETAQSVSVVTAAEIEIQNAETLTETLNYTAGVQALAGDSTTSDGMVIRGFNVTGTAPTYLNGTKLARATFSGVTEPYGMERIELLRGPASVLYGNAAPGGIVNMVTKLPQADPLRELTLQIGSGNRRQLAGDLAGRLTDDGTLTYRVTGLLRRSDTFVDHIPDNRGYGAVALRWEPNADTSITVLANHQDNDTRYYYGLPYEGTAEPNRNGRIARDRFTGEPAFNRFDTRNSTAAWMLSHRINDTFSFRQNLLTFRSKSRYADIWGDSLDATERLLSRGAYTRADDNRAWTLDNQLEARWRSARVEYTTVVGLDFTESRFDRLQYAGTVEPLDLYAPVYGSPVTLDATPEGDFGEKSRQLGVYVQQHMKLDEHWVLTVGGRYDTFKSTEKDRLDGTSETAYDDNAFTSRLGLIRLFSNGLAPYLSYSQSFEPISGQAFDGSRFKPTKGRQYELGLRYQPPGTGHAFTASVYDLTQTQVSTADLAHPTFSIQQGEVRSRGLELEARARLRDRLNLIAAYTFVDNEVTKSNSDTVGNRMGGVPRHMASIWLDYAVSEAIGVGGGVRYFGSSTNLANTVDVNDHTVVDAVVNYRPVQDWLLSLNLKNLFDQRYVVCTYACFYGAPRTAMLTATWRW